MNCDYHPVIRRALTAAAMLVMLAGLMFAQNPPPGLSTHQIPTVPPGDNIPLQFTSGGHALRFSSDGIMVGSRDHLLRTRFIGSNTVAPETGSGTPEYRGRALPLSRVTYHSAWEGVTVAYEASAGAIFESTFYLDGPEKAALIRMGYNRPISIDGSGNLVIAFESGRLVESAPVAWQEIGGDRHPVTVAYALRGEREAGFTLSGCVPGLPVVIDPYLTWNTFLGAGSENANTIAADAAGNLYVAGKSSTNWGNPVRPHSASSDAFVARLSADNGTMTWNTFLGGSGQDEGWGIALDSGSVYVVGESNATWGGGTMNGGNPVNHFVDTAGNYDTFVARLSSDNGSLVWNTFMGDNATDDRGFAITADGSEGVYAAGNSFRTWGSPVRPFTGSSADAFTARLIAENGTLNWNTFLGGGSSDYAYGIAYAGGSVYMAGHSVQTWGSPVRPWVGSGTNACVVKLDSTTGVFIWNTFIGGGTDHGRAVAADGSGNIYLAGYSGNWWGSPVEKFTIDGGSEALVAKIADNGSLLWHSFLGGYGQEFGQAISFDGSGNVYTAGYSSGPWGNPVINYHQPGGGAPNTYDAFTAKLYSNGVLAWNAFLGSTAEDKGYGIALDGGGNIYAAGYSWDTWGSPVDNFTSPGYNTFVAKVNPAVSLPGVYTGSATNISRTAATLGGQITTDGGEACQYRFCWGKTKGAYTGFTAWTGSKTYYQDFSENITGLAGGTTYYYIAQVKNGSGTASGYEFSFTTTPPTNTGSYGWVGAGITTPARILHVFGNAALFQRAQDSAGFIIQRTDNNRWVLGVNEAEHLGRGFVLSTYPTSATSSTPRLLVCENGTVIVPGMLTKGGGSFKIDHPLDPQGRFLQHSFVESPDMLNVYSGNVILDDKGEAAVELPAYFPALNRGFSYQLDCVGGFAPVYVKQEIKDNSFTIAGGKPGLKVSWQVTGIRKDPFALANPVTVELEKPNGQKGFYQYPPE